MTRSRPLVVATLLIALAASGVWGSFSAAARALQDRDAPVRDPIEHLTRQLAPVASRLGPSETLGLVHPAARAPGDRAAIRGLLRYVLAPRAVLDGAGEARWILTQVDDDAVLEDLLAEPDIVLVLRLRNGVTLLERRVP